MSSGSWGVVHEPAASGPLNADALADTNNVLVNTAMFHAVSFQPEAIQVLLKPWDPVACALHAKHALGSQIWGLDVVPKQRCVLFMIMQDGRQT